MVLPVRRIELHLTEAVRRYMRLMDLVSEAVEKTVKQEALPMALLIQQRVRSGGELSLRGDPRGSRLMWTLWR